jgi:hypothetical protein
VLVGGVGCAGVGEAVVVGGAGRAVVLGGVVVGGVGRAVALGGGVVLGGVLVGGVAVGVAVRAVLVGAVVESLAADATGVVLTGSSTLVVMNARRAAPSVVRTLALQRRCDQRRPTRLPIGELPSWIPLTGNSRPPSGGRSFFLSRHPLEASPAKWSRHALTRQTRSNLS